MQNISRSKTFGKFVLIVYAVLKHIYAVLELAYAVLEHFYAVL